MTEMPPRWQVGLALAGCALISLFTAGWRLTFKPTDAGTLKEVSAPAVGWERKRVGEGDDARYDLLLQMEGQPKKFRFSPDVRPFGSGFDTVEQEAAPGTPLTVKVDASYAEGSYPAASAYALSSPEKTYLTLEQAQDAERADANIAAKISLAFGVGAVLMFLVYRHYDRLCGRTAASEGDGGAAVVAAVARLAGGTEDAVPASDADFDVLAEGWLLVPSAAPVSEDAVGFAMPSTTNGAGEKVAYLFSHRAAFDAWGGAPHFAELRGRDAFRLVLANGFAAAVIDFSGPRMLGLTRGVIERLAADT